MLKQQAPSSSNISKLKGITQSEMDTLAEIDITTIDQLWSYVGRDRDEGIALLAEQSSIGQARLIQLLAQRAINEARHTSTGQRIIQPLVAGVVLVGMIVLLVRALQPTPTPTGTVVVQAPGGLPAFQVINANDIALNPTQTTGAYTSTADVQGRYALQPIPPNTPLRAEQLSQITLPADALAGRTLLAVPVPDEVPRESLIPGGRVTIQLVPPSADGSSAALVLNDALILQLPSGTPPVAIVAVKADDSAALLTALATSSATLLPARP